ncbi:hypothetical protein I7I50_06656 [Histoplasma capsulatum G186AR]|uniref:Uncharacterized protein n=1 Tax=Ajellomyces capsulatus TaxID=5037 RepID=A0A8H7Z105_AJECA|nr:hypothetical protein I7I52_10270 [Histoplasma capsulatum]QSS67541.1 hypothetical protein I7I50_06656 [Histoplasma capsulatum G186AR]
MIVVRVANIYGLALYLPLIFVNFHFSQFLSFVFWEGNSAQHAHPLKIQHYDLKETWKLLGWVEKARCGEAARKRMSLSLY